MLLKNIVKKMLYPLVANPILLPDMTGWAIYACHSMSQIEEKTSSPFALLTEQKFRESVTPKPMFKDVVLSKLSQPLMVKNIFPIYKMSSTF